MNVTWFVIRGSGLAAFVLLSASMIWGLWISTKTFGRTVKAKGLQWLHESLGLSALIATVVHLVALSLDEYVDFTWVDILVPGVATWKPLPVALGVVAFWSVLAVSLSFYVKKWIGQSMWRTIHYLSFGSFAAAIIHGITAGTDTGNPFVMATYVGSAVAVVMLTAMRMFTSRPESGASPAPARQPAVR
jgi:hypothetical protein